MNTDEYCITVYCLIVINNIYSDVHIKDFITVDQLLPSVVNG